MILGEIESLEREKGKLESYFTEAVGDDPARERNTRRYAEITDMLEAKVARWEELAERSGEM